MPCRPDGLFPPADALLAELGARARTHAFEKHLAGRGAPAELLPRGSWASGNAAALAGLFYQVGAVLSLHVRWAWLHVGRRVVCQDVLVGQQLEIDMQL